MSRKTTQNPNKPNSIAALAVDQKNRSEFERELYKRNQGLLAQGLSETCVMLVGLGSVGSYIAEKLVRAGVGSFILIDPDEVEAHNLTRTTYQYDDIGRAKTACLKAHLKSINPWVNIKLDQAKFEAINKRRLKNHIDQSHMIICSADDKATQAIVNRIAQFHDKPLLVPGLYKGAKGGEVVISIPKLTPCLECSVHGRNFLQRTDTSRAHSRNQNQQEPIIRQTDYGTGRLEGEIAIGADIHHVAGAASKLALSILSLMLSGNDVEMGKFAQTALAEGTNYLLMGMTPDYWIFKDLFAGTPGQYAFQSLWVETHSQNDCPVCGGNQQVNENEPINDPIDFIATEIDPALLQTFITKETTKQDKQKENQPQQEEEAVK